MARTIQKGGGIRSNNTTQEYDAATGETRVRLYKTVIATLAADRQSVKLDTGGYDTPTTLRRMNECLHAWGFINGPAGRCFVGKSDFSKSNARTYTRQGLQP